VVHHGKNDILKATTSHNLTYWDQPTLNGTGGALLAAEAFFRDNDVEACLVTMGDVPFVRTQTFRNLINGLQSHHCVVLGFQPKNKRQYGVLETAHGRVLKIVEWTYWSALPPEKQKQFTICNAGIYAFRKKELLRFLPVLKDKPHMVRKQRLGRIAEFEEYFITDLVELMTRDGLSVGNVLAKDDDEVMGIDDLDALQRAQQLFSQIYPHKIKGPKQQTHGGGKNV
jgi:bifunctional UDP-N-acetylglucosamine pyrophosphorylase/glucosamine-1-phosphate N-acetyltransferase